MNDACHAVLRKVETYLDGELGSREAGEVARHLNECPECLEHEVFLSRLRAILRTKLSSSAAMPGAFPDRVREVVEAG